MSIENTARTARETPIIPLVQALVNPHGFVEAQEAQGAAQVLASELLPVEGDWDRLTSLGFVKGEPVDGDDLFLHATLPAGWTKHRTEHYLYTEIRDERGVPRVNIGYKAAFYDRWARISVIDVAYGARSTAVYDGALPEYWDKLTLGERKDAENYILADIAKNEEVIATRGDTDGYWAKQVESGKAALTMIHSR